MTPPPRSFPYSQMTNDFGVRDDGRGNKKCCWWDKTCLVDDSFSKRTIWNQAFRFCFDKRIWKKCSKIKNTLHVFCSSSHLLPLLSLRDLYRVFWKWGECPYFFRWVVWLTKNQSESIAQMSAWKDFKLEQKILTRQSYGLISKDTTRLFQIRSDIATRHASFEIVGRGLVNQAFCSQNHVKISCHLLSMCAQPSLTAYRSRVRFILVVFTIEPYVTDT